MAEFGVRRVMASAPKRGKKGGWGRAETKYFGLLYKIDGSRLDFLVTPMTLLARLLLWKRKT